MKLFVNSSFFFMIIIFPLTHLLKSIKANKYEDCERPFRCGTIDNIRYPFYDEETRPAYCGYPGFKLNCSTDYGFPEISSVTNLPEEYLIIQMDLNSNNISVSPKDLWRSYCPENLHNTTLNSSLFNFTPTVSNVSLYYHCATLPTGPSAAPMSFSCPGNDSSPGYFVTPLEANLRSNLLGICEDNIIAPVYQSYIDAGIRDTRSLQAAIQHGFGLNWIADNRLCADCRDTGGQCGYNTTTYRFTCYCPDETHGSTCNNVNGRHTLSKSMIVILASVSGAGIGIAMLIVLILYFKRKYPSEKGQDVEALLKKYGSPGPKRYSYTDLKRITHSFKDKLGEGGYGVVYKGKLHDDHLVAVKILKKSNGDMEEFINEVASIGNTNHINIVKLLGFCYESQKRALVYDYMLNGSLEKFTYGGPKNNQKLSWEKLFDIAVGIARGLEYLHQGCNTRILHFDIKPQNILLDENFCAKISDFGLAKSCLKKESIVSMSEARGTIGYIAPEVFFKSFGGVSHKSDVYSYGMLLLEMVGCRNNTNAQVECSSEQYFPHWVYKQLEQVDEVHHQGITNSEEGSLRRKMVLVSLWCIQTRPASRPTITRVMEMLEGTSEALQIPPMPSFASPLRSQEDTSTMPTISLDNVLEE